MNGWRSMKSYFSVLKTEFHELEEIGYKIEINIFANPALAIINSRMFAEKLLVEVVKKESQFEIINLNQYEKIRILNSEGILDDLIVKDFDDVRIIGNKVVHEGENNDIEYSVRLHKKLYNITKWFFESYSSDYKLSIPEYIVPEFKVEEGKISISKIDEIFKRRLKEFIEETKKKAIAEEIGIERNVEINDEEYEKEKAAMEILGFKYKDEILEEDEKIVEENIKVNFSEDVNINKEFNYTYKKLKGSYLLNELSKLSTSSQEAVESSDSLDAFKSYLHVGRSIQNEIIELLEEASTTNKSQLILLCGSVGDGKSHLLAYINENKKELVTNFKIHNDATESFDPKLTEIDTLVKVLDNFSDNKIDSSNEKLILAINLGVLNNFLEADFAKENYKKLINFIDKSKVFDQEIISNGYTDNNFKLVSFGNYNIYEITDEGYESHYIEDILNKVVSNEENNPFYNAYLKDKSEGVSSPVIINYGILMLPGVVKRITNLLIKIVVKYKKLVSTREIFNFIYEVLVSANIEKFDLGSSTIDYIDSLLPNLLFNSLDRGKLLSIINKEDIIRSRHEKIDELLINLNIKSDIIQVLEEYVETDKLEVIDKIFMDLDNINLLTESLKQDAVDTVIRLLFLVGNNSVSEIFIDEDFERYITYLYYFNCGQPKEYKNLFDEVKQAIFNWNDSYKDNYIYLTEKLQYFMVAEKLELKPSKVGACEINIQKSLDRFKSNINIAFEVKSKEKKEILEVDYQLYKKIVDINKGYYASKNDREEAVVFKEYIDRLIALGNMETELLIEDKRDKKVFKLIYEDEFDEEFRFERVE